jgi:aspartyl-tRNA(Asn)/glutamyl-tRNA(Gln) amidotransferase subunit B
MRSKEEAFDYRYFPEPDLPPLAPEPDWVEDVRGSLPELPAARRERYVSAFGLRPEEAKLLAASGATAAFFEEAVGLGAEPKAAANWVVQDLAGLLNKARQEVGASKVTPRHVADLVTLVGEGTVSVSAAKQVLEEVFETGEPASEVIERRGLRQVTDASALEAWVDEAIAENPGPVEQFRGGKENALNALVGPVMRKSGGSASATAVRELLLRRLSES